MNNVHIVKVTILSAFSATGLLAAGAASAADIMARVISSTPVVQQVAVPRQVCNTQQVTTQTPKSGGGALLGAVAGGAAGNAIGSGGGRAVATMLGVFGGALLGDNIEGPGRQQVQNVQQCGTQTYYENRPSHYNVVYEYQGTQYSTQMASDPGQFVRLQISPVGGLSAPPQPAFQGQQQPYQYQQPQQYQQSPQYQQPQQFYQQSPQPQTYFQQAPVQQIQLQQPVYIQPISSSTYFQPYYQQAYYAPALIAPVGVSLNLGYSRSYGGYRGYGGHHWR